MGSKPSDESAAGGTPPTVFLADPSAEAERIAQVLRTAGYLVADVPLSMLFSRVAVQRPDVVLLDVDAEGALTEMHRVRELPEAAGIDIVFFGKSGQTIANADDALDQDASGFFPRPVDIGGLLTKLRVLTGGPEWRGGPHYHSSTPPPSIPSGRLSTVALPLKRSPSSYPPPPQRASKPPSVLPPPPTHDSQNPAAHGPRELTDDHSRAAAMLGPVSPELQKLLEDAEQKVAAQDPIEAAVTPEEELEAVLPADILAALDEPLDDADPDDPALLDTTFSSPRATQQQQATSVGRAPRKGASEVPGQTQTGSDGSSATTGARHAHATGPDGTPNPAGSSASQVASRPVSSMAPPTTAMPAVFGTSSGTGSSGSAGGTGAGSSAGSIAGGTGTDREITGGLAFDTRPPAASSAMPPKARAERTEQPAALSQRPKVTAEVISRMGDFAKLVGQQVRERSSGALCVDGPDGVRRIVFNEGDFVTAASGRDEENLLSFLVVRGDLPRSEGVRLAGKIPPFGRHAGAALVAHGHLSQDQLWSSLRAHAEWISLLAMKVTHGSIILEPEASGRLRGEPSVFGGTTGAAVFVDLVRRAFTTEEAVVALGGLETRLADGTHAQILAEAGLDIEEERLVLGARGISIDELSREHPDADIPAMILALVYLGVFETIAAVRGRREADDRASIEEIRILDEEAVLARVRARLSLVEEGDYFAVLGVSHDATGYEVRRAFLELRRAFEPSKLLSPRLVHLIDDVKKIVLVLEEAYEILRDPARRERYRRAISEAPTA